MKTNRQKACMIPILVIPILLFFSGCYSSRQITGPMDIAGSEIEVVILGDRAVVLQNYSIDSLGVVRGLIVNEGPRCENDLRRWDFDDSKQRVQCSFLRRQATIPADSIKYFRSKRVDAGKTVAAGIGIGLATYGVVTVIRLIRAYQAVGQSIQSSIPSIGPSW